MDAIPAWLSVALVLLGTVASLTVVISAAARRGKLTAIREDVADLYGKLGELRTERDELARKVDVLEAENTSLKAAIRTLEKAIRGDDKLDDLMTLLNLHHSQALERLDRLDKTMGGIGHD